MADHRDRGAFVYRHGVWTRTTHWLWALSVLMLTASGLQIFNAFPSLHIGAEAGFEYDNAVLEIGAVQGDAGLRGVTRIGGLELDTTGTLGVSGDGTPRAFPAAVTLPAGQSLATGRVVHFFFAWVLVGTLLAWAVAAIATGHLRRDLIPTASDLRDLPRDAADHARLRFRHGRRYGPLQKLAYAGLLLVLFPLVILTGLTMSPAMNAALPWTLDLFGGRQTARTLHFVAMVLIWGFVAVHLAMILLAGPLNELRSILTGWYRTDTEEGSR